MMTCDLVREEISAVLDGEPAATTVIDQHLAGCAPCQVFQARGERLRRSMRLQSIAVPDLTERVLTAVAQDPAARQRAAAHRGRSQVLRVALAISAVLQLVLAIPVLLTGAPAAEFGMNTDDVRVSWEMASFEVAVAVGFGLAAWRPTRAAALVPVAAVLAACLLLIGIRDVATDPATLPHNVGHALVAVQAGLLVALSRLNPVSLVRRVRATA